ncbi:hypothetical protein VJ918_04775 [Adlercreutzia sp. R21]|uniref:hypothetical protein n=1 Tax=Adlercreutzia wanghongyangiae TaxID=3111451 RepID=UPI002DB65647|nr:hypothetical protein [Adlercreutzia sp. R21]MEC4184119.1 hypothetical protein [Adlercreutzia sp. R21]
MAPNKHIIFPLDNVEDVAQLVGIPYGELFHVSMNRWNGNVVFAFQDHPEARFFIRLIVAQLAEMVDMFDEDGYRIANHGLIDYEDEGRYEHFYGAPPRPRPAAVPSRPVMEVA